MPVILIIIAAVVFLVIRKKKKKKAQELLDLEDDLGDLDDMEVREPDG